MTPKHLQFGLFKTFINVWEYSESYRCKVILYQSDFNNDSSSVFSYLDVLCECIENLLGHIYCLGEIPLALLINNIFPRIVPVEITDRLLEESEEEVEGGRRRGGVRGGEEKTTRMRQINYE